MHIRRPLLIAAAALAAAALPATAQAAAPANDAFAAAQPLTLDVPVTGTTVDSTVEAGEPKHADETRTTSVWYAYTPTADSAVTFDACQASFDDVIATYTGTSLATLKPGPAVDDACDLGAKASLQVTAGVTTYIAISGVDETGTFTLVAHAETVPPNDAFADAIALKPGRVQGANVLATRELGEPRFGEGGLHSVWYRYRTNTRQRVTLDTANSSFDTMLGVFNGDLGSLKRVAVNDDVGDDDDQSWSRVTFTAVPRRTYWIAVDGYEGATGSFELGLSDGSVAGYGITVAAPEETELPTVLQRGLRTTVGCRIACRLRLQVRVGASTARRIGLPASANRVLAQTTGSLDAQDRQLAAVLRFSRAARRALSDEDGVTVQVRAELLGSRSGNRYVTRTVRLTTGG